MSSDAAAPPPEWEDPDETAAMTRPTEPGGLGTTVPRARRGAGVGAEPVDDATVRSKRKASASGEACAGGGEAPGGPPPDAADAGGSARAGSSPDPGGLREPYAPRPVPVVAPREAGRTRPQAGPPVDSAALARRIRTTARRRTAAVAAASIVVLAASATLLAVLLSGGA